MGIFLTMLCSLETAGKRERETKQKQYSCEKNTAFLYANYAVMEFGS